MRSTTSRSGSAWRARDGSKRAICSTRERRMMCSRSRAAGGISFPCMRNKQNPPRQPLSRSRPKPPVTEKLHPAKTTKLRRGASRPKPLAPAGKRGGRMLASRRAPATTRAPEIFERLHRTHPDAKCALNFDSPYQLLVATILSAQCTDKRVNMVTPALFRRYPTADALAAASPEELEQIIKSTGFFRSKSRSLIGMATGVTQKYGGVVPSAMEQLVALPGVGRKTANVILGNAFNRNEGVVVDTHVSRLSQRLALTKEEEPAKIEQ